MSKTKKASKKLPNKREIKTEDVYLALADLIIDSFLENNMGKKVIKLEGAQLQHKGL